MFTKGKWIDNEKRCCIESSTEYLIEPCDIDEDGTKISILNYYCTLGGNDIESDLKLICSAPDMWYILERILNKDNIECFLTNDEIAEIKTIIEQFKK